MDKIIDALGKTRKALNATVSDRTLSDEERDSRIDKLSRLNRKLLLVADSINEKIEKAE